MNAQRETGEVQDLVPFDTSALVAMQTAEIDVAIATAKKFPRSIAHSLLEAKSLVTESEEVAASCIYSLPRAGKKITGPSARQAEMMRYGWGNMRTQSRIIAVAETYVEAQAVCHDLEKNVAICKTVRRPILKRDGSRFDEDMILVTCAAACVIAERNATFGVIPKSFVDRVYEAARLCACGDQRTLPDKRADTMSRFSKMGIQEEKILAWLGRAKVDDIDLDDLERLFGIGTAIKNGDIKIDDAFRLEDEVTPPTRSKLTPAHLKGKTGKPTPASEREQDIEAVMGAIAMTDLTIADIERTLDGRLISELTHDELRDLYDRLTAEKGNT